MEAHAKAVIGSTVVAEVSTDELVKIESNWYFSPSSLTDGGWSYPEPIPSSFDRVGQDDSGYVAFDRRVSVSE